jgi:hypothetical protein
MTYRCAVGAALSNESAEHDVECVQCKEATSHEVRPFGLLSTVIRMVTSHVAGNEKRWQAYGEHLCQQLEQDGCGPQAERFRRALRGDVGATVHPREAGRREQE